MTAFFETADGLLVPRSRNGHEPAREAAVAQIAVLESRIAHLEAQIEQEGWERLDRSGAREFSRDALEKIIDLSRVMYLKNPLVNRAVEVGALYVWGQDLSIAAEDEGVKAVVDRFWRENAATLTGQQASRLLDVELSVTGNVFLALFPDRATGNVRVRTVPVEEIRGIETNPEDRYEPWYYRRVWRQRGADGAVTDMEALHPDWQHRPAQRPATETLDGRTVPVRWDAPIRHVKTGAFLHWRWGVPEVYAALDWARAYKELLEDDATRSRALARFAWNVTSTGGKAGVAAAKAKLGTTFAAGGIGTETNPPPVAGSAWIHDKSLPPLDPIRIAGATLPPEHSRPARLMASAALGISDHFFDTDVGNHATASTLDRPTELRYGERRQLWREVYAGLIQWAIDRDTEAARGLLTYTPDEEARRVELSWPDLLEKSVTERVDSVWKAATLGAPGSLAGTMTRETAARLMLTALGVENVDDEIAALEDEWAEQDARRDAMAQLAQQQRPPGGAPDEEREAFVRALRRLEARLDGR